MPNTSSITRRSQRHRHRRSLSRKCLRGYPVRRTRRWAKRKRGKDEGFRTARRCISGIETKEPIFDARSFHKCHRIGGTNSITINGRHIQVNTSVNETRNRCLDVNINDSTSHIVRISSPNLYETDLLNYISTHWTLRDENVIPTGLYCPFDNKPSFFEIRNKDCSYIGNIQVKQLAEINQLICSILYRKQIIMFGELHFLDQPQDPEYVYNCISALHKRDDNVTVFIERKPSQKKAGGGFISDMLFNKLQQVDNLNLICIDIRGFSDKNSTISGIDQEQLKIEFVFKLYFDESLWPQKTDWSMTSTQIKELFNTLNKNYLRRDDVVPITEQDLLNLKVLMMEAFEQFIRFTKYNKTQAVNNIIEGMASFEDSVITNYIPDIYSFLCMFGKRYPVCFFLGHFEHASRIQKYINIFFSQDCINAFHMEPPTPIQYRYDYHLLSLCQKFISQNRYNSVIPKWLHPMYKLMKTIKEQDVSREDLENMLTPKENLRPLLETANLNENEQDSLLLSIDDDTDGPSFFYTTRRMNKQESATMKFINKINEYHFTSQIPSLPTEFDSDIKNIYSFKYNELLLPLADGHYE